MSCAPRTQPGSGRRLIRRLEGVPIDRCGLGWRVTPRQAEAAGTIEAEGRGVSRQADQDAQHPVAGPALVAPEEPGGRRVARREDHGRSDHSSVGAWPGSGVGRVRDVALAATDRPDAHRLRRALEPARGGAPVPNQDHAKDRAGCAVPVDAPGEVRRATCGDRSSRRRLGRRTTARRGGGNGRGWREGAGRRSGPGQRRGGADAGSRRCRFRRRAAGDDNADQAGCCQPPEDSHRPRRRERGH